MLIDILNWYLLIEDHSKRNWWKHSYLQVSTIDFHKMGDYQNDQKINQSRCMLQINSTFWVSYDTNLTFLFSGKVYKSDELMKELQWSKKPLRLTSANNFPTNKVMYVCQDLPAYWSCKEKAEKCKKILRIMGMSTILLELEWKPSYDVSLLTRKGQLLSICMISVRQNFNVMFKEKSIFCLGADEMFQVGLKFCRKFLKCIDTTMNILTKYGKEIERCKETRSLVLNDNSRTPLQYGIRRPKWANGLKFEFVKAELAYVKNQFSNHFLSQCAWKQPLLLLSNSPEDINIGTGGIICERNTIKIVRSLYVLPSCHKFIAECSKIFSCINGLKRCYSSRFGGETNLGFLVKNATEKNHLNRIPRCQHWAVELNHNMVGQLYCSARRYFKLKNFTFCESYTLACSKLVLCVNQREICHYIPEKRSNFSTEELPEYGIVNFKMAKFIMHDDPRNRVVDLFKCNKEHGYQHQVFLYFITASCIWQIGGCNLNMSFYKDEQSFHAGARRIVHLVSFNTVGSITRAYKDHPEELVYIWACKRETFAAVTCSEFLRICEEIKKCMENDSKNISIAMPSGDNLCFSPLPVNTLFPTPMIAGSMRDVPNAMAPGLSHVLPLDKTYPRIFKRIFDSAWEAKTGKEVQNRRENLFFNLFLEDCRYRHKFEGFLTEPYLTEEVNYLICSVPFGMDKQGGNPLVALGCSHIQQACEKMKQCYIHHAEYFNFHSFINENVFTLAVIMIVTFLPSFLLTILTQYKRKIDIAGRTCPFS